MANFPNLRVALRNWLLKPSAAEIEAAAKEYAEVAQMRANWLAEWDAQTARLTERWQTESPTSVAPTKTGRTH